MRVQTNGYISTFNFNDAMLVKPLVIVVNVLKLSSQKGGAQVVLLNLSTEIILNIDR